MLKPIYLVAALFCCRVCYSQATLPQMVQTALAHNPALTMVQAEAQSAEQDLLQSKAERWPAADLSGSYRRQSAVPELHVQPITLPFGAGVYSPFPSGALTLGMLDNYDLRLTVTQPVFTGFRLSQKVAAGRAGWLAKSSEISRQRAELIHQVERAYGQVLKSQKYIEIAQSGREQIASHLRDVMRRVEQGLLNKEELLQVKVRLSEAELAVVQAENSHAMSLAMLENLLAEKIPPGTVFSDMPQPAEETVDLERSLQLAYANRPELSTLAHNREASQAMVRIAQGGRLPAVAAFGSLGYGKPGLDMIKKEWMDYWVVGVGLEWQVWNWGKSRAQVQQAKIRQTALGDAEKQLREAIRLDVTQSYLQWQETSQRQQLCTVLQDQAEESFRVAERRYQQGVINHSEYFDQQAALTRARLARAQAEIDYRVCLANLNRAAGVNEKTYTLH